MARQHVHKVILEDKRIWRCVLPECRWFIHLGLARILLGKRVICWRCEEPFTFAESDLKIEKPICADCLDELVNSISAPRQVEEFKTESIVARTPVDPVMEANQAVIPDVARKALEKIKLMREHDDDCGIFMGGTCDCNKVPYR